MKKENKTISILGCGWLGLPLAQKLIKKEYTVKGSTTSENKISVLKEHNIKPFLVTLSEDKIDGCIQDFLNDSDILIVDIPPKLRSTTSENFVSKIKLLIAEIEKSNVQKVLFISSTSVYADGFPIEEITEETPTNPETESGKQLVETEQLLLSNTSFETTILRFGGLLGEDRNPIKHLAGRENVANAEAPINFIHQEDCIGIITAIVEKSVWNTIFNAVAPQHPTRKEYYTAKAKELKLTPPTFDNNSTSNGKIVSSAKIMEKLDYRFIKSIL